MNVFSLEQALIMTPSLPKRPAFKSYCVLQVVPSLDTGGVEQTVLDMAQAIIKDAGRALVATSGGRMVDRLEKLGAEIIIMPVHSKNPLTQFSNYFALKSLIKRKNIDIIHVRSRAPALACLMAAKATGIKSIATYHGIYNAKSKLKRHYNGLMTRADLTIANSDYTREHILKTYTNLDATKIISVPRGINLDSFVPSALSDERVQDLRTGWGILPDDNRPKFLLAGRLTRWKGQTLILQAASFLKQQGQNNFLILFAGDAQGRADYHDELNRLIATYDLGDNVKIVGHCTDMPAGYALCDFALAPSLDPEAFGRTAVEPQAMQKPVLAAAHGATVETVLPDITGWLIRPKDADAWAKAIDAAINLSPDQRMKMGQAGHDYVREHFSLTTMCSKTLALYHQLLTTPSA